MSSSATWPLSDDLAVIDAQIAALQLSADQARASSAMAASEVAMAQKAIRDLTTAKAEILEKEKLWARDSQLQRVLAERQAIADQVRHALAAGGSLEAQRKADLETALKTKAGIAASGTLDAVFNAAKAVDDTRKTADTTARDNWRQALTALDKAKNDYATKAAAAEEAWAAIQHSARSLEEHLSQAQRLLARARGLTESVELPSPLPATPQLNPEAATAGLAWKDFVDSFDGLKDATKPATTPGRTDMGEQDLVSAWESARDAARNALAVWLEAQKTVAEKQQIHEQRQAPRPGRGASERDAVWKEVRKALTPPASPIPGPTPTPTPTPTPGPTPGP